MRSPVSMLTAVIFRPAMPVLPSSLLSVPVIVPETEEGPGLASTTGTPVRQAASTSTAQSNAINGVCLWRAALAIIGMSGPLFGGRVVVVDRHAAIRRRWARPRGAQRAQTLTIAPEVTGAGRSRRHKKTSHQRRHVYEPPLTGIAIEVPARSQLERVRASPSARSSAIAFVLVARPGRST